MKRIKQCDDIQLPTFYTTLSVDKLRYSTFISQITARTKILKSLESKHITCPVLSDDVVSHFSLRLTCAQSIYAVKWFTKCETEYLNRRLQQLDQSNLREVLWEVICNTSNITEDKGEFTINWNSQFMFEHKQNSNAIDDSINFNSFTVVDQTSFLESIRSENVVEMQKLGKIKFYKLIKENKVKAHFTKLIDLIEKITPNKGYLCVNDDTIISLITNLFRRSLNARMMILYTQMRREPDERLLKIHNDLFKAETPSCKSSNLSNIEKYLPPCMSGLLKKLKNVNHLKYKDRLVLTRFMKDAGLSVQECIFLFKTNFKNVNDAVFDKEYLYSIRHSYGLEGKRASYQSYSCKQLIEMSVDRDTFSCPMVNNRAHINEYLKDKNIIIDIEELPQKTCCNILKNLKCDIKEEAVLSPIHFYKIYKENLEK
ncbi:DNA primase subunit pri2 [Conglomerata obtusa]